MVDKILESLGENAPVLAGVLLIVILFLRHLGKTQDQWNTRLEKRDELTSELQKESTKVIKENAEALVALKVLIEERIPKASGK